MTAAKWCYLPLERKYLWTSFEWVFPFDSCRITRHICLKELPK